LKPPAKAMTMSTGPSSSSTRSRMRSMSSGDVTSPSTPIAVPPAVRVPSTTSAIESGSRPPTATLAPLWPSATHVAAPMPLLPPVTTTTLSARSGNVGVIAATVMVMVRSPPWG
jgi:hypothetical protein